MTNQKSIKIKYFVKYVENNFIGLGLGLKPPLLLNLCLMLLSFSLSKVEFFSIQRSIFGKAKVVETFKSLSRNVWGDKKLIETSNSDIRIRVSGQKRRIKKWLWAKFWTTCVRRFNRDRWTNTGRWRRSVGDSSESRSTRRKLLLSRWESGG